MGLLFREHPKAQPGRLFFVVVFLEKPGIEPIPFHSFDRVIRDIQNV